MKRKFSMVNSICGVSIRLTFLRDMQNVEGVLRRNASSPRKEFAMMVVPDIIVEIDDFNHCMLSVLKREVIGKIFGLSYDRALNHRNDITDLMFKMVNCSSFDLVATPDKEYRNFDVVTIFDNKQGESYAFGKTDGERVRPRYIFLRQ